MDELYQILHARLVADLQVLPDKSWENPRNTLCALWHTATGQPCSARASESRELAPLSADGVQQSMLEQLVARRLAGEPLAYLTGREHFMGLEMLSAPQALIPRVESELLARACIELLRAPLARASATIIDLCTGSGNVAYAMAAALPSCEVFGSDLSADAIALAARNGRHLGLQGRVELRVGDLLGAFEPKFAGRVDLISCVPPYIQTTKVEQMAAEIAAHEPALAFDGGPFGVSVLMRLVEDAPQFLRTGGWLAVEVGLGQGPALMRRLQRNPAYTEVRTLEDENGAMRAILACRR